MKAVGRFLKACMAAVRTGASVAVTALALAATSGGAFAQTADLTVSNLSVGSITANSNGSWSIPVTYTVTNIGTASAQPSWKDMGYLSADGNLDDSDQASGGPNYYFFAPVSALAAGASYSVSATFTTSTSTAPGTYTFFVKTDGHSRVYNGFSASNTDTGGLAEANESNNTASAQVVLPRADLSVSGLAVGTVTANQNGSWSIPMSFTVTNVGNGTAPSSWVDMGYLSADGVLDNSDQAAGWPNYFLASRGTALAPGQSYTVNSVFTTSTATVPGTYSLFVKADGRSATYQGGGATNTDSGGVIETNEGNNTASAQVVLPRADLTVSALSVGTVLANQNGSWSIPVTYTVTNVGNGVAPASWVDMGYLSANAVLDNSDQAGGAGSFFLGSRGTPLAPGESYTVGATFTTSTTTVPGTYTFFVKADGRSASYQGGGATNTDSGGVIETNEGNNTASSQVVLPRADLTVSALSVGTVLANQNGSWSIPVTYTVTNVGNGAAPASWVDMGYLSADAVLDNSDQAGGTGSLFLASRGTPLAPGESYTVGATFTTSTTTVPGTYTFFVKADGRSAVYNGGGATNTDGGNLLELTESNNLASAQVQLARPNLKMGPLALGTIVNQTDGSWTIPVSFTVSNTGTVSAQASWYDIGYLSTDGTLSNGDQSSGYLSARSSSLAPGSSYTVNAVFRTTTTTAPGAYTFFVKTDGHNASYGGTNFVDGGSLVEADEADNVAAAAVQLNIQSDTTTLLTVGTNPVVVGHPTTLTATLSPAAATGSVIFKDGSKIIASGLLTAGAATATVSFASPGAHSLSAEYSSDPDYRASRSAAVVETVNKSSTTTTLTLSAATAAPDQPVQLMASVQGVEPDGVVTFYDGGASIGSAALSGGTGEVVLSFTATGSHSLTVSFPGDANNQGSASAAVTLNVDGSAAIPPEAMMWTYGYDANGNQRYAVDPNGNRTDWSFDALQQVTSVSQPAAVPGGARPVVDFAYDGSGQVSSVTDPRNLTTNFTVNGLGGATVLASPDTGTSATTYDAAGNVLTRTDARGLTTTFGYDALNRQTSISYPSGTPSVFEYDGGSPPVPASIGKLTRITDESGSTTYTHDALGRLALKSQVMGTTTLAISYEWGSSGASTGKLTSMRYPSGAQVNYAYDAAGRISGITLNPVYGSGSGTDTASAIPILGNLAYTGTNEPRAWVWGDGVTYQRSFDSLGRLASYPLGNPAGTGPAAGVQRTLSYDNASRITGYTHSGAAGLDQSYAYDGLDRLTDAIQGGTPHGYGYDDVGNRTQRRVGAQTFTNGVSQSSNRLTSVQDYSGTTSVSYDAAGNVIADGLGSYIYSARGRMSAATLPGGTVNYLYNALEQRVSKTGPAALVPTGASYYAYDEAGRLLGEYDAAGVPRYETVYLGDTPVAVVTQARSTAGGNLTVQSNMAYVYSDHLDTPRVLARAGDHAILWRWDLAEAFGATPAVDDPNGLGVFTFNQRFPGQVFDAETGLHYNGHRDYSPRVGRYQQSDPIGLDGGVNTFAYVQGNPVQYVDPLGQARHGGKTGQWWEFTDRNFQRWFHQCVKGPGDPDATREELADAYAQWVDYGRPDGKNGCGGPPPAPAGSPAGSPAGAAGAACEDCKKVASLVMVGGTAYVIYRCIRMIPSLFPPLWPTIPLNAVAP